MKPIRLNFADLLHCVKAKKVLVQLIKFLRFGKLKLKVAIQ